MEVLASACAAVQNGQIVILFDGDDREGEADMILGARFATPEMVECFRKDAGGLICAALTASHAAQVKLPFLADALALLSEISSMIQRKTAYGDASAFSLPVNHKDVFTGIPDNDRSLTLRKLDEVLSERPQDFLVEFHTPGHVPLLIGRGIENRRGHTELSLELARRAGLTGPMVLCEMLGTSTALSKDAARAYALKHGLVFLEGKEVSGASA